MNADPAAGWTYRPAGTDDPIEIGTVRGRDVALPAHFHDEDQITVVLSGRRRFWLGGELVTLEAGGCAVIPAGRVHRSLVEPAGVDALNLYAPAGWYGSAAMRGEIERLRREAGRLDPADVIAILREHRPGRGDDIRTATVPVCRVAAPADRAGASREAFSRAFTRRHGMPPHAFGLVSRLNHARRLLRSGERIVDVALDAGFADQSHLGRCFRRIVGVSPGRYKG